MNYDCVWLNREGTHLQGEWLSKVNTDRADFCGQHVPRSSDRVSECFRFLIPSLNIQYTITDQSVARALPLAHDGQNSSPAVCRRRCSQEPPICLQQYLQKLNGVSIIKHPTYNVTARRNGYGNETVSSGQLWDYPLEQCP